MRFWERPDFVAMQSEWYSHLAASGFEDAERMVGTEPMLRQFSGELTGDRHDERRDYFTVLSQCVHVYSFAREVDRIIMAMRAEGAKITHICEELRRRGEHRDRRAVRFRIRVYEMEWGLRKYTPKQLGRKTG